MVTKKQLRNKLVEATKGCNIQHNGWPCNTCFHALDLPLKEEIHEYWLAVLAFRGDYPDIPERPDLITELSDRLDVYNQLLSVLPSE